LDKPWVWHHLSINDNITINILLENPDKPWNYDCLSMTNIITIDFILANLSRPWNWTYISENIMTFNKKTFIKNKILQRQYRLIVDKLKMCDNIKYCIKSFL